MRADMGKVLVERPRLRSHSGYSGVEKGYGKQLQKCLNSGEPPPRREGMKARYGKFRKFFNENLAPLRRFLDSNVGRPWDKVYAEICRHVDRGNVVQKHVLTHLFDYVVVRTVLIDGQPCRGEQHWGYGYGEPLRTSHSRNRWYVCPKSGLLRKSKYVPYDYRKRPEPPRTVKVNNRQVCVERDGRWELISVVVVSQISPPSQPIYEQILAQYLNNPAKAVPDAPQWHGGNRYAVTRRVLSRREVLAMPIPVEWLT